MNNLQCKTYDLRLNILEIVMAGKCGHIGGDMSVIDILAAIYDRMNISPETADSPDRDRFVLSKGHCVEALYAVLASKGFLNLDDIIRNYSKFGSEYIGHPHNCIRGIEMNSGSLGHGLSISVGMALAGKRDGKDYRVFTVLGDGELAEGSVWEAAMAASHYGLDNLCAVIDRNHMQISGSTESVMNQENLHSRFSSFGWNVFNVADGNSIVQLNTALSMAELIKGKPTVIIANTVKGCGSAIMENNVSWHHRVPTQEEYEKIKSDLLARKEALDGE